MKKEIIDAFTLLGEDIKKNIDSTEYQSMIAKSCNENRWFTSENIKTALINFTPWLDTSTLENYVKDYDYTSSPKRIAVICAGNIPAVGWHDVMTILLTNNFLWCKLSSSDSIIIPFLIDRLSLFMPEIKEKILYMDTDRRMNISQFDGVIATGSSTSAMYFEKYFSSIPHIIRKNRSSVAIITNDDDILGIEDDILSYFSLGCRNVSTIFLPKGYDMNILIDRFKKYSSYLTHDKYRANYDYRKAVFLMNNAPFIDAGIVLLDQSMEIYSPISILNYYFYENDEDINAYLLSKREDLQCIVCEKFSLAKDLKYMKTDFSYAQKPKITDFADGVNTMQFLGSIVSLQ